MEQRRNTKVSIGERKDRKAKNVDEIQVKKRRWQASRYWMDTVQKMRRIYGTREETALHMMTICEATRVSISEVIDGR